MNSSPYGIGVVDLTKPNYKNSGIYGNIELYEKIEGAIKLEENIKGTIILLDYVAGAISVDND